MVVLRPGRTPLPHAHARAPRHVLMELNLLPCEIAFALQQFLLAEVVLLLPHVQLGLLLLQGLACRHLAWEGREGRVVGIVHRWVAGCRVGSGWRGCEARSGGLRNDGRPLRGIGCVGVAGDGAVGWEALRPAGAAAEVARVLSWHG